MFNTGLFSKRLALGTVSMLAGGALALSGCEAKEEKPPPVEEPTQSSADPSPELEETSLGHAIAIIDGNDFEFALDTCRLEADELLASGPGSGGPDGEAAWFDVQMIWEEDQWGGGMQVTLGTDHPGKETGHDYFISLAQQEDYNFSSFSTDDGGEVVFEGVTKLEDGNTSVPAQVAFVCGEYPLKEPSEYFSEGDPATDSARDFNSTEECMLGTWTADNDYFYTQIRELGDEVQSITGTVTMIFQDDGTMITVYDDWLIDAISEGAEVQIERAGQDVSEYRVSGDTVYIEDVEIGSMLTLVTPGMSIPIDPLPAEHTGATVECGPNFMTVTVEDGVMQMTR